MWPAVDNNSGIMTYLWYYFRGFNFKRQNKTDAGLLYLFVERINTGLEKKTPRSNLNFDKLSER